MEHPTNPFEAFGAAPELPPVPFARVDSAPADMDLPPIAPQAVVTLPDVIEAPAPTDSEPVRDLAGTSISELLDALRLDGISMDADSIRPHAEFSGAVERRRASDRRAEERSSSDRRAFASSNLAMPDHGPVDPRPQAEPTSLAVERPAPIDSIMPELPLALEPSRPYVLPNKGVVAGTIRGTRPNVAVTELPFPASALVHPPAPVGAPEPPPAPQAEPAPAVVAEPVVPVAAPDQPTAPTAPAPAHMSAPTGLDGIFVGAAAGAPIPVGRLEPFAAVAAVASTPSAWFGEAVHMGDEAMLVWNAPGTTAPLAPAVASMIAPAAAAPSSATPSTIATTTLAPAPAGTAAAATGATAATRGPLASLLRLLLIVGVPATSGIGIALAIDRFLL